MGKIGGWQARGGEVATAWEAWGGERKRWGRNRRDKGEREQRASAAAVFLKIRKSCHPALLFFVFFSGQVIGSLTPKNHFQ